MKCTGLVNISKCLIDYWLFTDQKQTMRPITSLNKRHRKPKAQSRMDNSDTSNGYTRHRTKTKKKQSKKKTKNNTTQTTVTMNNTVPHQKLG